MGFRAGCRGSGDQCRRPGRLSARHVRQPRSHGRSAVARGHVLHHDDREADDSVHVEQHGADRPGYLRDQSDGRRSWPGQSRRHVHWTRDRNADGHGSGRRAVAHPVDGGALAPADLGACRGDIDRCAAADQGGIAAIAERRADLRQLLCPRRLSRHRAAVAALIELHYAVDRIDNGGRTRCRRAVDWRQLEKRQRLHRGRQPHAARHVRRQRNTRHRDLGRQALAVCARESRSDSLHRRRPAGWTKPDVLVAAQWRHQRVVVHRR